MSHNITPVKNQQFKIHKKSCLQSFIFQGITKEELNSFINNMKSYFAPGFDEISPTFVKVAKFILSLVLTKLYNKCFHQK